MLREQLVSASPDLARQMLTSLAQALMSADVDAICGADYGEVSPDRVNRRNGYRSRDWDTRVGTIELQIPKLREGTYFPTWLLERRRRAEQALISVVATSYLLGVSTRRVDKLVQTLGIEGISKSQVSELTKSLDEQVASWRSRPLDAGPYAFLWVDALTQRVREGGRTVNVHALLAVGVNGNGQREVLGVDVVSSKDGAGWLAFLRDLVARGLTGVRLVTSDAHSGLVDALAATLPGAAWQRCRTHYARNLSTQVPSLPSRGSSPCCARSSTSQTAAKCAPSSTGWRTRSTRNSRRPPNIWPTPATTCSHSPRSRGRSGRTSGATTHRKG